MSEQRTAPEMLDEWGQEFSDADLERARANDCCPRCEGDGATSDFPPCTTNDYDCACNGPRVSIDPCPLCGGSGEWPGETT